MYKNIVMKIIIKSLLLVCITIYISFFWLNTFSYEISSEEKTKIENITKNIQQKLIKKGIFKDFLIKKINLYISKNKLNDKKKTFLLYIVKNLENSKNQDNSKKNDVNVLRFSTYKAIWKYDLYPYYKNKYLPKIKENILQNYIFKKDIWEKKVFLTFDDGPNNGKLISYLKSEKIPATFFMICGKMKWKNIDAYKNNLFSIWWHTLHHKNYDKISKEEMRSDFQQCDKIFKNHNLKYSIFRPAFGVINKYEAGIVKEFWVTPYIWSIDSLDWNRGFNYNRINQIEKEISWWDIILFHENVDLKYLNRLIKDLKKMGYSFWKLII